MFISETKSSNNNYIKLNGYTTIYNSRKLMHKNAPTGSGGTAFLVRNELFGRYKISRGDDDADGILQVNMMDKHTGKSIALIGSYLPPENSVHA